MARSRPVTGHPAFAPLIALWFAALLGLTVAVLPAPLVERSLAAIGLHAFLPLTTSLRVMASVVAAILGALAGYGLARIFAWRAAADPRPVYDSEPSFEEAPPEVRRRSPLRVREELSDDFGDDLPSAGQKGPTVEAGDTSGGAPWKQLARPEEEDGFMILTPQPTHPPRPAPDLEALLEQFDSAFASFSSGEGARSAPGGSPRSDPVQAFVAQQTGVQSHSPVTSPLGGLVPDHQAELRAALDKLARSQRGE